MEVEYLGGIMMGEMLAFEGIDFPTYFLLKKKLGTSIFPACVLQ